MKHSLRLSIPAPCSEDWEKMLPAERGRHCEQCCKTVVDFTGMSDGEVLSYFKSRASGGGEETAGGVCGRFAGDQLGRELAPAPVQRNGVKGWPWVVAGAMMIGQGPDGGGAAGGEPGKAGVEVRQAAAGAQRPLLGKPMRADLAAPVVQGTTAVIQDTSVDMGVPVVTVGEVVESKVCIDTIEELPADTVTGWQTQKRRTLTGLVGIMPNRTEDKRNLLDTVTAIKVAVDSVASAVKDTVAAVMSGFVSNVVVKVFPNPVARGGMLRLEWGGGGGRYQLALVSAGGAVVEERMVEVAGKGQIDEWRLPNGLTAGVYFLRLARPGERVNTMEVIVQ